MEVAGDARAGGAAKIQANVEAFGPDELGVTLGEADRTKLLRLVQARDLMELARRARSVSSSSPGALSGADLRDGVGPEHVAQLLLASSAEPARE